MYVYIGLDVAEKIYRESGEVKIWKGGCKFILGES